MAENMLDSLNIEISSSADNAVKSLNGIISSLKKLDRIGKSGGLMVVQKQLKSIASIKFDKLNEQLAPLAGYIKELKSLTKTLSNTNITSPTVDFSTATASLDDTISDIEQKSEELQTVIGRFGKTSAAPDWFNDVRQECEKTVDSFLSFSTQIEAARDKLRELLNAKKDAFGDTSTFVGASSFATTINAQLQKLNLTAELLQDKFNKLSQTDGTPNKEKWYALEKAILSTKIQYQSLLRAIDKNAIAIDSMGDKAIKAQSKMSKLFSKLKNMLIYRLGYSIFHQISQMAGEGLQNIAQYSEEANAILSEYKTEYLYLKNSIASTLLPFLQQILPIVIRIGDALVDVMNNVGIIIAKLNGESTFIKAKKYAQDYADTLAEVKRYTTGFDELNILGSSSDSSTDTSEMFETVDISDWDFAGAIAKITTLVTAITALVVIFKGKDIVSAFTSIGKGLKQGYNAIKNSSKWTKAATAIATIAVEGYACYDAFYGMYNGTKSVIAGISEIAIVGVAAFAMLSAAFNSTGIGAIISAVVIAISAIVAGIKAAYDATYESEMAKFWQTTGIAIDEVTAALSNYLGTLGIDKQAEWNETLAETISELNTATSTYNTLWAAVQGGEMSTALIDDLADAFNSLADAANAVNEAAIGTLMASIATGIELNITPELTARLGELVTSLEVAQDLLNSKITGISAEYQKILNDIANNDGNYTAEQYERLKELREELDTYTLTDQSASVSWNLTLEDLQKQGIALNFDDEDSLYELLQTIVDERDDYLDTMQESFASNVSTLTQLIELYPDLFSEADLEALTESYNAARLEVNDQVNAVIQAISDSLSANVTELSAWDEWGAALLTALTGGTIGTIVAATGNVKTANKKAYDTEQGILTNINGYKGEVTYVDWTTLIPAHANGGFVEDGLFMANHSELVGEFANGKTAVANNEQIIEGIKQGVIEAMSESGNNQGGDWTIQIVDEGRRVKSETIISALERKNRRDGKTVISIGG